MICGIGTDLAEISRLSRAMERHGDGFADRIFTPAETAMGQKRSGEHAAAFFAGRWAAKEAAAKALGCGFGKQCSPCDIEILANEAGAPVMSCRAPAFLELQLRYPPESRWIWHISITHEKTQAAAFVILEVLPPGF